MMSLIPPSKNINEYCNARLRSVFGNQIIDLSRNE